MKFIDEHSAMNVDYAAILRNRGNNVAREAREWLWIAADVIQTLQHRIRCGDWPKPIEEAVNDPAE